MMKSQDMLKAENAVNCVIDGHLPPNVCWTYEWVGHDYIVYFRRTTGRKCSLGRIVLPLHDCLSDREEICIDRTMEKMRGVFGKLPGDEMKTETKESKTTIQVYLVDGNVFEYGVDNTAKAREHADAIITKGWRNVEEGVMVYYPVHRVLKVKFAMPNKDKLAGIYFARPANAAPSVDRELKRTRPGSFGDGINEPI